MKDVLNYSLFLVSDVSPRFLWVADVICGGEFFIVQIEPGFVKNVSLFNCSYA